MIAIFARLNQIPILTVLFWAIANINLKHKQLDEDYNGVNYLKRTKSWQGTYYTCTLCASST